MTGRTVELIIGPLRAMRRAALIWSVSIALLIIATVAFWPAFEGSSLGESLDQMPSGVVQALGMQNIGTPAGFLRGNLYEFLVPLLLIGALAAMVSGQFAGEENAGRLELVLSQPVSRAAFWCGRAAALVLSTVGVLIVVFIAQAGADVLFGLKISMENVLATIVLCGLLALLHAALGVAVAGFTPRPSLVLGVPVAIGAVGYVVLALFPLTATLAPWRHLSPWDWAFGGDPLANPTAVWRYAVLVVPILAVAAVGLLKFSRRDIRSA